MLGETFGVPSSEIMGPPPDFIIIFSFVEERIFLPKTYASLLVGDATS